LIGTFKKDQLRKELVGETNYSGSNGLLYPASTQSGIFKKGKSWANASQGASGLTTYGLTVDLSLGGPVGDYNAPASIALQACVTY
jgi:hypothetical protein